MPSTIKKYLTACCFSLGITAVSFLYLKSEGTTALRYDQQSHSASERESKLSHFKDIVACRKEASEVEDSIGKCMEATHLSSVISATSLVRDAKSNARYLYQEFRKVIPQSPLEGYRSYCWNGSYSVYWDKSTYGGYMNNITYKDHLNNLDVYALDDKISYLHELFPKHGYNSSLLCLPKVFMPGFPKCGSTFTACLVRKLIWLSTYNSTTQKSHTLSKEPPFWNKNAAFSSIEFNMPTVNSLGRYLFYFLPGLHQISDLKKKDLIVIDSKVGNIYSWPQFKKSQHNLTNYCLLPSVLPKLLPGSKYIVIMRNPVRMLYSAFWYSCSRLGKWIPMKTLIRGPDIFHSHVVKKINLFNNCMRNSSMPSISEPCQPRNYTSCILQQERLLLLDKCTHEISFSIQTSVMPNCGFCHIDRGLYIVHVRKWLSTIPREDFHFILLEDMIKNSVRNAHDILMFLGLDTETVTERHMKEFVNRCNKFSQTFIKYKSNPKLQMREDTKKLLDTFYKPFNFMLGKLVSREDVMKLWQ